MITITVFGLRIELNMSFFALAALLVVMGNGWFALVSTLFSFLHEGAHALTARAFGYTPIKISAGLFGGVLHLKEAYLKPLHELFIHLSGPLFNLVVAASLYSLVQIPPNPVLEALMICNVVLGIFNLMPFYPLDGGKIANLYMAFFFGFNRAQKVSRFFSFLFSLFLFLLGIYLVQYNVVNILVSAMAVNLYSACRADSSFLFYKMAKSIEVEKHRPPKVVVYRTGDRAVSALSSYKPMESRLFMIVNEKGGYRGHLSEDEVLSGIYDCGIYADFQKIIYHKKSSKNKDLENLGENNGKQSATSSRKNTAASK